MMKFKTDKVELLKELRKLVSEELGNAKMNVYLESEVAEFLTEVTDRRRSHRLKLVGRALDNWIDEMVAEKKKENVTPDTHS
jgi:hypothetical protein